MIAFSLFLGNLGEGFWFAAISLPISYATALFVGAPIFLLFEQLKFRALPYYLAAGALTAVIPAFFVFVYPALRYESVSDALSHIPSESYGLVLLMIIFGCLIAGVFWLIARPDRA
jgi:hypothetical protein